MKRLTLMRHADAQWKDAQVADFDRPLTRRGNSEAEAMSRRLAELSLVPSLLVNSSAVRARQTAEIVARELGIPPRHVRSEESLYLAGAPDVLALIQGMGPRIAHLLVIGHNPGISELTQVLAPARGLPDLTTGAICSLTFDARKWSGVGSESLTGLQSETPPMGLFRMWA